MGKRFVKQLGQFIVTLFGITFLTFCLTYLAPGDPVTMLLETADTIVSQELIDETRAQLGLDKPFVVQYANWVVNAAQGDLGMSYSAKKPVVDRMLEALPGTLMLAGTALVFTLLYALPAGIISALNRNKWVDYVLRFLSFVGVSMPTFWLGLVLIYIFGLKLGLVPIASSRVTASGVILPAITLAVVVGSKYMRQVRLVILEEMQKDYVIGARARGVSEIKILFGHILPNAVLPLITILGVVIGWLLGGVAVVEMVFSWPGLGNMAVYAITMRDYPLIEGFVLWVALESIMAEFIQKHKLFSFYSGLMIIIVLIAIFAPWLAPGDAFTSNISQALQAPSSQHWFGTDKLGRDVLSRIIYGTQLSLFMGVSIVVIMVSIGTIIGAIAGYFGGKVEMVLMRLADIMLSFPGIVLAIAIAGILGGSIVNTILALSVVGWAKYARIVRSMTLKVRGEEYVTAAVMMGASTTAIIRRHIIPNIMPLVITTGALDIGAIMIEVAGLSFLGFGAQPPTPEWGLMLNEGRQYLQTSPWLMAFPGMSILIVVAIFNLWSDSLRDVVDPKNQG